MGSCLRDEQERCIAGEQRNEHNGSRAKVKECGEGIKINSREPALELDSWDCFVVMRFGACELDESIVDSATAATGAILRLCGIGT